MSLNANDQEGSSFVPAEALEPTAYPARVVQIIDMGLQKSTYQGKEKDPKTRLYITYELTYEFLKDEDGNDDPTKPRWISEDFPFFNLGADRAKSTLRYTALDPSGAADGEWSKLLGAPCVVTLTKEPRKGKEGFTNYVSHVGPAPNMPGYEQPPLVNDPKVFDMSAPDVEVFKALPTWLQERMKENLNYDGSPLQAALGEKSTQAPVPTTAPAPPPPPSMDAVQAPPMPPIPDGS